MALIYSGSTTKRADLLWRHDVRNDHKPVSSIGLIGRRHQAVRVTDIESSAPRQPYSSEFALDAPIVFTAWRHRQRHSARGGYRSHATCSCVLVAPEMQVNDWCGTMQIWASSGVPQDSPG